MKRWGVVVAFLSLLALAVLTYAKSGPEIDINLVYPPVLKKVPLKVAVLIPEQLENYTLSSRIQRSEGGDTGETLTFPLGLHLKKASLEILPQAFDRVTVIKGQPYPPDIDAVVTLTLEKFRAEMAKEKDFRTEIKIKVELVDLNGKSIWDKEIKSPEINRAYVLGLGLERLQETAGSAGYEAVAAVLNQAAKDMVESRGVKNYAESRRAPVVVVSPPPAPASPPRESVPKVAAEEKSPAAPAVSQQQYAVVIGISNYKSIKIQPLKYTRNDALSMYKWLTSPKGGAYPASNVELLVDQQANLLNIRTALGTWLARRALKGDTVFIFYAGHGASEPDSKSEDGFAKYLVPYDADPGNLYATALPMKEVSEIFDRIEAERIIFVADACYSGASGGRTLFRAGVRSGSISSQFLDQLSQPKGRVVITASETNEVSGEIDDLKHGIFTYYLLEALEGMADTNNDEVVDLREAYEYLYEKVARHSKWAGFSQHPVWKGDMKNGIVIGYTK